MKERPVHARPIRHALITCWLGSVVLLAVLHWTNRGIPVDTWAPGNLSLGFALGLVGVLVTGRLPANPLGWIFLIGGTAQAASGMLREVVVRGAWPHGSPVLLWEWIAWVSQVIQPVTLMTLPLVLLHFPDGQLPSDRWRFVRKGIFVAGCGLMVLSAVSPGAFTDDLTSIRNPIGLPWAQVQIGFPILIAMIAVLIIASLISLIVRWRHSDQDTRHRLSLVVLTGGLVAAEVIGEITGYLSGVLAPFVILLFICSIGFAVLRHHLWDLDVVISVSLVYGVLTALAAGLFVAAVAITGFFVDGRPVLWPTIVALGAVLATVVPLRHAVQAAVDRMFYGRRRDHRRMLAGVGRRIAMDQRADQVLQDIVEEIAATYLRLDHVAVHTDVGSAATGRRRSEPTSVPILFQGKQIGILEVAPRQGSSLTGPTLASLHEVAEQIASVIQSLSVAEALRGLREEVAAAREEERRRLRRDIHDGVGPALAAVALQVEGAAAMVDRQPELAKDVLQRLGHDVTGVLDDVRRIVHDLVPPVLDALGLEGALRQQAVAFSSAASDGTPGLEVVVLAHGPLGELPAGVELAAYRIGCEALTNVTKHAAARRCTISLALHDERLLLTVDDDGVGLHTGTYGVGTLSMIERATAIGGTCRLETSPWGGVRVAAGLPVTQSATPSSRQEVTQ